MGTFFIQAPSYTTDSEINNTTVHKWGTKWKKGFFVHNQIIYTLLYAESDDNEWWWIYNDIIFNREMYPLSVVCVYLKKCIINCSTKNSHTSNMYNDFKHTPRIGEFFQHFLCTLNTWLKAVFFYIHRLTWLI